MVLRVTFLLSIVIAICLSDMRSGFAQVHHRGGGFLNEFRKDHSFKGWVRDYLLTPDMAVDDIDAQARGLADDAVESPEVLKADLAAIHSVLQDLGDVVDTDVSTHYRVVALSLALMKRVDEYNETQGKRRIRYKVIGAIVGGVAGGVALGVPKARLVLSDIEDNFIAAGTRSIGSVGVIGFWTSLGGAAGAAGGYFLGGIAASTAGATLLDQNLALFDSKNIK